MVFRKRIDTPIRANLNQLTVGAGREDLHAAALFSDLRPMA